MRLAVAGVFGVLALGGCSPDAEGCDRVCLSGLADAYIGALAAGDPSAVPLASPPIMVEDLVRIEPGEGLWNTVTGGATDFAIHVPDVARQTVGWMGVIEKESRPVLLAVRLKYENGAIAEAEHLTAPIRPENMASLRTPRPGFLNNVPEEDRLTREELIEIGRSYYDAVDTNDGALAPFAVDCERHENGALAAGLHADPGPEEPGGPYIPIDCAGQLSSNLMAYIGRIDNRRVFAVDPVRGLVMGFSHFRHPMDFEPFEVTASDGSTVTYSRERYGHDPFDLPAAHVFKVGGDHQIHEIEAMGFIAPYNSPTGWE